MRYIDGPTTEAQAVINAPVDIVWALISDINLPAKFSSEFQGADWIDATPEVGAAFAGRNHHAAIGGWQTTCTVTRYVDHEVFEWYASRVSFVVGGAGALHVVGPTLGPDANLVHDRAEGAAELGEFVLHAHRHLGVDAPRDYAVALQVAELTGEHLPGDVEVALERAEPGGSLFEGAHDQDRPPIGDALKRFPGGRALAVERESVLGGVGCHDRKSISGS